MRADEISDIVLCPHWGRRTSFFKVAKRVEMDNCTVAAGSKRFGRPNARGIVTPATIAFGGVRDADATLAAEESTVGGNAQRTGGEDVCPRRSSGPMPTQSGPARK